MNGAWELGGWVGTEHHSITSSLRTFFGLSSQAIESRDILLIAAF